MTRDQRATIRVLKQELKLIGMGAILYWGYTADLVALAFMVPVLVAFQTVIAGTAVVIVHPSDYRRLRWRRYGSAGCGTHPHSTMRE